MKIKGPLTVFLVSAELRVEECEEGDGDFTSVHLYTPTAAACSQSQPDTLNMSSQWILIGDGRVYETR